jgi:hypothetical protein
MWHAICSSTSVSLYLVCIQYWVQTAGLFCMATVCVYAMAALSGTCICHPTFHQHQVAKLTWLFLSFHQLFLALTFQTLNGNQSPLLWKDCRYKSPANEVTILLQINILRWSVTLDWLHNSQNIVVTEPWCLWIFQVESKAARLLPELKMYVVWLC